MLEGIELSVLEMDSTRESFNIKMMRERVN